MSTALEAYCAFVGCSHQVRPPAEALPLSERHLSETEIALLIPVARSLRERAMIATLAYAGLRNRELCRLRTRGVDLDSQTARRAVFGSPRLANSKRSRFLQS